MYCADRFPLPPLKGGRRQVNSGQPTKSVAVPLRAILSGRVVAAGVWPLVLALAFAQCQAAWGKKIFLLMAADTSVNGGIALSTGPDAGYVLDAFYAHVPKEQLVVYNFRGWPGPDIGHDLSDLHNKLITAIRNCPAGPDDTVVFFYSGHGAYDPQRGHFLQMPDRENVLYRKVIAQEIQRKGVRLAVVITDSCNMPVNRGFGGVSRAYILPPEKITPLFDELFMKPAGLVDINSAAEGEFAVAPIGGGLFALAMAYMGSKPRFQAFSEIAIQNALDEAIRDAAVEVNGPSRPGIPALDYGWALVRLGFGEHMIHPDFDGRLPPYGFLWDNARARLTWRDFQREVQAKMDELFRQLCPNGLNEGQQKRQTLRIYSFPKAMANVQRPIAGNGVRWSAPIYRPEVGDHIVEVNGRRIKDTDDFRSAVKNSPPTIILGVVDQRTGRRYTLRTQLNPPDARSRLGIVVRDCSGPGVHVMGFLPDAPGRRCQLAQ